VGILHKDWAAMRTFSKLQDSILTEIGMALRGVSENEYLEFCSDIAGAGRIVCFGLGREGLAVRAFCMRLAHLGLDAHMAGDVTALPIGPGDLLVVTSGPGNLTLTRAMIEVGHRAGGRVTVVTAQPDGPDPEAADAVVVIPAQTMADDRESASVLPMGTAFEIAMGIFFDLAVIGIQDLTGQTNEDLRARHFNLE
jgi:6-phospho-3-hexuloisomerase